VTSKAAKVYQFKISLKGIKPPIWRRIQVPEDYSFWDLHVAIQNAMGWIGYHLHLFEIFNPRTFRLDQIGILDDTGFDATPIIPETKAKIARYFSLRNNSATYEYDFGDGWEHKIFLEKIVPADPYIKYPICIAGRRACPPEDCGGVWGYEELLEIINDPNHEEYEERMEWLGYLFKPEEFNPDSVKFNNPSEP
jgi:hypothetical protein